MNKRTTPLAGLAKELSAKLLRSSKATHGLKRALRRLLKEIVLFENHISNAPISRKVNDEGKNGSFVQIGGGRRYLSRFLNIDIVPPADIISDVREGIPVGSGKVKFLFSEHFLEHIDYPVSVKKFIKECFRVLRKGGQLVIGVPDAALAVKAYFRNDRKLMQRFMKKWYGKRNCVEHFNTRIDFLNYHFRDQDDDKKYSPHLWAYDYEKLEALLAEAGFREIRKWDFDPRVANPKRKFGSVYITAVK